MTPLTLQTILADLQATVDATLQTHQHLRHALARLQVRVQTTPLSPAESRQVQRALAEAEEVAHHA